MKAIKILKKDWIAYGSVSELGEPYITYNRKDINEAVAELEELDNRSCESCKHIDSGPYDVCPIAEPISRQWLNYDKEIFSCNRWEKNEPLKR